MQQFFKMSHKASSEKLYLLRQHTFSSHRAYQKYTWNFWNTPFEAPFHILPSTFGAQEKARLFPHNEITHAFFKTWAIRQSVFSLRLGHFYLTYAYAVLIGCSGDRNAIPIHGRTKLIDLTGGVFRGY